MRCDVLAESRRKKQKTARSQWQQRGGLTLKQAKATDNGSRSEARSSPPSVQRCNYSSMRQLQARCVSVIQQCTIGLMSTLSSKDFRDIEDDLNRSICSYLTCDKFFDDSLTEVISNIESSFIIQYECSFLYFFHKTNFAIYFSLCPLLIQCTQNKFSLSNVVWNFKDYLLFAFTDKKRSTSPMHHHWHHHDRRFLFVLLYCLDAFWVSMPSFSCHALHCCFRHYFSLLFVFAFTLQVVMLVVWHLISRHKLWSKRHICSMVDVVQVGSRYN